MKTGNYIVAYISALVIGILLLIFHDKASLYNTVVLVIGILIAIPSLILLLTNLFSKVKEGKGAGYAGLVKWTSVAVSLLGIGLGIWMVCNPAFFINIIIYTLGGLLLLVGVLQMVCIYQAARPLHPAAFWFIVPVLCVAAGVIIICLGPAKVSHCAGLVTGIVLIVYAVNGFASAGREAKLKHDLQSMEAEKLLEEKKDEDTKEKGEKKEKKEEEKQEKTSSQAEK